MIELDITPEQAAKDYGVKLTPLKCLGCKKFIPFTKAIAIKGYRGVAVEDHGCDKKYNAYRVVPVGKEEKNFWNKMKGLF